MICGFKWWAPYFYPPPSNKVVKFEQQCILKPGHEGNHQSLAKVTHKK